MKSCNLKSLAIAASFACALLSGCGGGGGGGSSSSGGDMSVAATDAANPDIASFTVDVTALNVVNARGAAISALPATTRVDFADLRETSDLMSTAHLPEGIYSQIQIGVDFTNAVCTLTDGTSATLVDDSGNALTGAQTIDVRLPRGEELVITRNAPAHLVFDFDLDQSCEVDPSGFPSGTVQVHPTFRADAKLHRAKITRIRGPLQSVDVAGGTFTLEVRPLRVSAGAITIATDASTQFDGDSLSGTGAAGLAELAAAATTTAHMGVVARGKFDATLGRFLAQTVDYGTNVVDGALDVAEGLVLQEPNATTAIVVGRVFARSSSATTFNVTFTATLGAGTIIHERGSSVTLTSASIGVGQRVLLAGNLSGSAGALTLDVTTGTARLLETELAGNCSASLSGAQVGLNVRRDGFRGAHLFTPALDASALTVDVTGLTSTTAVTSLTVGDPVAVIGFFTPGGSSGFRASMVVNRAAVARLLIARWPAASQPTTVPFNGATTFPLTLDAASSTYALVLLAGAAPVNLKTNGLPSEILEGVNPFVSGATTPLGPFLIRDASGAVTLYTGDNASGWLADVNARIATGEKVAVLTGIGGYSSAGGTSNNVSVQELAIRLR